MTCHAWIVPESWLNLLDSHGGVSSCYSVPVDLIASWEELAGTTLFIVARGKLSDFIFSRIFIDSVDVGVDDSDSPKEYLLNVNVAKSLRISRINNPQDIRDFALDDLIGKPYGFHRLSDAEYQSLNKVIGGGCKILFTHVPDNILNRIDPPVQLCGAVFAPMIILKEVLSRFSLPEMWGSIKFPDPAANFASHYLRKHPEFLSSGTVDESLEILKGFSSPCLTTNSNFSDKDGGPHKLKVAAAPLQSVDISLTPIDPNDIKVRHFASHVQNISVDEVMRKTESAERRHQEMLRDISEHLIDIGVTPYQSDSIDLAIKRHNKTILFELKSISASNLVAQASKGVFQLLYYSQMLNECDIPIGEMYLVVEAGNSLPVLKLIATIVAKAGAKMLLYDVSKAWPNRLSVVPHSNSLDLNLFSFD